MACIDTSAHNSTNFQIAHTEPLAVRYFETGPEGTSVISNITSKANNTLGVFYAET